MIIADRDENTWQAIPKPHCHCSRGALECECSESACSRCEERFACITSVCDSEFCTDSECRLCSHEREVCRYQECLEAIWKDALENIQQGQSIADAHVSAVSSILAPGVGDAPIFPCTVRILDELLGGSHDWEETQRTWGKSLRWTCQDGSVIMDNPRWSGWLDCEEK